MNLGVETLPASCDVLVVGAGPSGSAAAILLARAGLDVVVVDAQAFPRDKICGDGLIPDAHNALRKLGVFDEVMRSRRQPRASFVGCIGRAAAASDVPGRARRAAAQGDLDEILCRAAVAAAVLSHVRAAALHRADRGERRASSDEKTVVGATLAARRGRRARCARRWLVLASGAVPAGADRRGHVASASHAERRRRCAAT